MGKIRINKLALELNVQNDQIIDALREKNIPAKNYMSSIDDETASYIRSLFTKEPVDGKNKKAAGTKAKVKAKISKAKAAPAKAKAKTTAAKAKTKAAPAKAKAKTTAAKAKAKAAPAKAPGKPQKSRMKVVPGAAKPAVEKKEAPSKPVKKHGLRIIKKEEEKPREEKKKEAPAVKAKKPGQEKPGAPAARVETKTPAPAVGVEEPPKATAVEEGFEIVQVSDNMTVREVAELLKCSPNEVIKELFSLGIMANINQMLNAEMAAKVADKRGFEVEVVKPKVHLDFEEEEEEEGLAEDLIPRPPIVTIMGHVDHGKTSLLDAIRKTNLTKYEEGGITQHIGAYQVKINQSLITFLDTPGHEAFTAMRARGAQVTDLVILVVAADDGIKPQTKEALDHARAAGVPILVAINKIDKPEAKPEEVKKQLADLGLLPEEWGGDTIFTEVSALQTTGIDHLLEMILLQAEVMELKSNAKVRARGVVIESKLDKGRGPVATVLVQRGTLQVGDPLIVGCYFGRVRALINHKGNKMGKAVPSTPVEVVGLPEVPQPGDPFLVVKDEKKARQISNLRLQRQRESQLAQTTRITMEDLHQQILEGKIKDLNLIIKADVQGSIQAVQEAFSKLDSKEVRINILHDAVGGITESDVLLASASNALIIGFNVRPTDKAEQLAGRERVDIRHYSVIYEAISDMKKAMDGMLAPRYKEKVVGRAEVREVFTIPKVGSIAGCQVISGKIERNLNARLIRDSVVVYQGKIISLRRFKEDVKEVPSGYECGLSLDKFQDLKQGDIVEPFILEEVPPS